MPSQSITASRLIPAPAKQLYGLIADYRDGHARIIPRPPFFDLTVDRGGYGAGTEITCRIRVMGSAQTFRASVAEPEPGRVLAETVLHSGDVTTFTVDPDGDGARVTIETRMAPRKGVTGPIEAWLTARMLRPLYEKELEQLERVALESAGKP